GKMRRLLAVLAVGAWFGMTTLPATAQQPVQKSPYPVVATAESAPGHGGCGNGAGCASPCHGGESGCCKENCFGHLWRWLCYKPLPLPCECRCRCCCDCSTCHAPPVYAFFLHPACGPCH